MKKIILSVIGLGGMNMAKALEDMPPVREFGFNSKAEFKKKKKRLKELARRQKRLDKMNK